ncbi:MAG: 30S ribosomal protein S1 [Acidimicrobiia bacterium]|nr:30S ribosomal protein S1 [Acidimicrobiia bacterium]
MSIESNEELTGNIAESGDAAVSEEAAVPAATAAAEVAASEEVAPPGDATDAPGGVVETAAEPAVEAAPAATEDVPAAPAVAVEPEAAPEVPVVESAAPEAPTETPQPAPATAEGEAAAAAPAEPHGERPAITAPKDIGDIADDLSAADFAAAVERTVFEFSEGDIVAGTVVRVDPDEVLVDIGYKSEGVIPANELSIRNTANPADVVAVGDDVEALVMQKEDESGRLVLSKKRAQYERAWGRIEKLMNEGGTVSGPVIEVVKGGLIVDIGLRGFLPASLVDLRRVRDLHPYVGEVIEAKVIELDKNRNNVVLSRRAYLEEAQAEQRHAFLSELQPGDTRKGVVSSVVNFGAFVDLGGMDGLVHVSELSWQHVSHPGEVVSVGDEVEVRVLEVDRDRERISLSIRQTREDPWDEFARDVNIGQIVDGTVTKTVPFGAFVSVGEGVEGLVHVSEIAMHHVESPELELSISQQVRVKVTEIDADRRRVSLSIKQALPEWEERSTWSDKRGQSRPRRREFQREEEVSREPSFSADASLEAILQELKEKGIGRS